MEETDEGWAKLGFLCWIHHCGILEVKLRAVGAKTVGVGLGLGGCGDVGVGGGAVDKDHVSQDSGCKQTMKNASIPLWWLSRRFH